MGLEVRCSVFHEDRMSDGRLQWEGSELRFRGDVRFDIPAREIKKVEAKGTGLHVWWGHQKAVFEIGPNAPKWAEKILHPPTRLDKLGVKAEHRVGLKGSFPTEFVEELRTRCRDLALTRPRKDSDVVVFSAETKADLAKAPDLAGSLRSTGALWIVYPKGVTAIAQSDVLAAGKAAGLVDVKVVSFSPTHSALKFVVPISRR